MRGLLAKKLSKHILLGMCLSLAAATGAIAGTLEQVSFETYASQWGYYQGYSATASDQMSISGDGQIVCFDESAGAGMKVQCRDRKTQTTEIISKNLDGSTAYGSTSPTISRDGRYVAFWSRSNNITNDPTAPYSSLYLFDRSTSTVKRIVTSEWGPNYLYAHLLPPSVSMSADGRYLVYGDQFTDFTYYAGQKHNGKIIDTVTGEMENIRQYLPTEIRKFYSNTTPLLSGDGRYISFSCRSTYNYTTQAYLYDRETKTLKNLSLIGDLDNQYYPASYWPTTISDNGQLIMLSSSMSEGWPLLYDAQYNSFTNVCTTETGELADRGCYKAKMSTTGKVVIFDSYSQNLYPKHVDSGIKVIAKNLVNGKTDWAIKDGKGNPVYAWNRTISDTGANIAFITIENLVETDTTSNRYFFDSDHYIYDRIDTDVKKAVYSTMKNQLIIKAKSALGAEASLAVDGFGPMIYEDGMWSITVEGVETTPLTVAISGSEGTVFVTPTIKQ